MRNLMRVYHDFFDVPDVDHLRSGLNDLNVDTSFIDGYSPIDDQYRNAVGIVAAYIERYGVDYVLSGNGDFNGKTVTEYINSNKSYARFILDDKAIDNIVKFMCSSGNMPSVVFSSNCNRFDGVFRFMTDAVEMYKLFRDAFMVYLIGFPIRDLTSLSNIKIGCVYSNGILQAMAYENIGKDWFNNLIIDAASYGMSIADWCTMFDGIWFDATNQLDDGFISVYNPEAPDSVVCISSLYSGEFFITSRDIFTRLYEEDLLGSIRFTDRMVKVASMRNGSVSERVIHVPVFYKNDEEILVSDLAGSDFVYNEFFWRNVGGVM